MCWLKKISLLILFLAYTLPLLAQTGRIEGIVTDDSGEPLIGVNVSIEGTTRGMATDIDGYYFILNVRPGEYTLVASYLGFQTQRVTEVSVSVDRTTRVNFVMEELVLGSEEITVTAQRNMIVMDRTSSSAKITGSDLTVLPAESFTQVVALQAGVTRGQGGTLHIRGGRSSEIKYYVDGMAVSNPFNYGLAVPVENTAVQEVEVISGTFNAEFGQANSGIINIVTKEGGENFEGTFIGSVGGYLSTKDDIFYRIDDSRPYGIQFYEGSLSGPTFWKRLKFFTNVKYSNNDGWLFGREVFLPSDSSNFASPNPDNWRIESSGDSSTVRMNSSWGLTNMGKLTLQATRDLKISYTYTRSQNESKFYRHQYRLNPGFMPSQFSQNNNHLLAINHILNNRTFYNLRFTANLTNFNQYVYEDPFDPRYASIYGRGRQPANMFNTGGVDNYYLDRNSYTWAARFDITRFIGSTHLVKAGVEYRWNLLKYEDFRIQVDPNVYGDLTPRILFNDTAGRYQNYRRTPTEFSAYIQDKLEIQDLIINIGLRYDYFDANAVVPTNLRDPQNRLLDRPYDEAYRKVDPKQQFSPRLGFAFPISADGVLYASYGQFFQIPEFQRLYENSNFAVQGGRFNTFIGNADLDAQRSVLYEIGLQQQLTSFMAIDLTIYHRDVRNLLGTGLYEVLRGGDSYGRYENADFGSVRGVTAAISLVDASRGMTFGLNYTFQSVRGNGSDPRQAFFDAQGLREATSILVPLDWDQTHNLTAQLSMRLRGWNLGVISEYRSGYPFTPQDIRGVSITEKRNEARYKPEFYLDLRFSRLIRLAGVTSQVFVNAENVLGFYRTDRYPNLRRDEIEASRLSGIDRVNSIEDFVRNPIVQNQPRSLRFGLQIDF
ncbi:MAG: TonB-dependent receptor [Balneolaceae bacterium]|nr:MAG: TonB-dependent receptor [Balneolaceae bacterium]